MEKLDPFKENERLHAEMKKGFQSFQDTLTAKPQDFEALVNAYMEKSKCSKGQAIAHIASTNPEAHAAYLKGVQS